MREQKPRGHNWSSQGLVTNKERTKPKPFKIFFSICLFLAALGLRCCTRAFSSCREQGLLLSRRGWASHCHGFSCGAQALDATGSVVMVRRLRWPMARRIFPDQESNSCFLQWQMDLNHWTTSEVQTQTLWPQSHILSRICLINIHLTFDFLSFVRKKKWASDLSLDLHPFQTLLNHFLFIEPPQDNPKNKACYFTHSDTHIMG